MADLKSCAKDFADTDTDVILYSGVIDRAGYESFCTTLPKLKRKKLMLVLATLGGDPNAGYRIARAAIHHYQSENFRILIPTYCKSAGTLIAIGAGELVMSDMSELGPLDVQFQKQDEIFQQSSGLDIVRGITYLKDDALQCFKTYLLDVNSGSGLTTKTASDIASKLVVGLYEPLFAQIDPARLGEMNAALQIANDYGNRLHKKSGSLKSGALSSLINNYPTHGFVIDRAEAKLLFNKVRAPDSSEEFIAEFVAAHIWAKNRHSPPTVLDFIETFYPTADTTHTSGENNDNPTPADGRQPGVDTSDQQQAEHPAGDGQPSERDGNEQPPVGGIEGDAGADAQHA